MGVGSPATATGTNVPATSRKTPASGVAHVGLATEAVNASPAFESPTSAKLQNARADVSLSVVSTTVVSALVIASYRKMPFGAPFTAATKATSLESSMLDTEG